MTTSASGSALERWHQELAAWALPDRLLAAATSSPYGWSPEAWRRRAAAARDVDVDTPTAQILRSMLGPRGTLLDVGAGTGRVSLPFAAAGHAITAVEPDRGMIEALEAEAASLRTAVEIVEGSWPESAGTVPSHDAVVCAHVVYNVPEIGPFVRALDDHAHSGVVVELTDRHPWAGLAPYYQVLHGLARPEGPTVELFMEAVDEVIGERPLVVSWQRTGQLWFTGWDEVLEHYGRRLVLPKERWGELRQLLEPEMVEADGRWYVGRDDRRLATVWWNH